MAKFKKGDKVIRIGTHHHKLVAGRVYTVADPDAEREYSLDVGRWLTLEDTAEGDLPWTFLASQFGLAINPPPKSPDPSKVKAGDKVVLEKDGVTVAGAVGSIGERFGESPEFKVGPFSLDTDGFEPWALIDHQPAPKPEWTPGMFGTATVRGQKGVRVIRTRPYRGSLCWVSEPLEGPYLHATSHQDDEVTDFVPDETRPTRDALTNALQETAQERETRSSFAEDADLILAALLRGESR